MLTHLRKVFRYLFIYGITKTLFKVAGRTRLPLFRISGRSVRDVGVIGCGQFAFSTLGHSLWTRYGNRFEACFDIDDAAGSSFATFYGARKRETAREVICAPEVRYVYILSNHATHTPYAVSALRAGKVAYVEKPISVTSEQLVELLQAVRTSSGHLYAGYNRPFSKALRDLRPYCAGSTGPLTLCCFVSGHRIPINHWYRDPSEGTRICGNVGHWIDLAVHILRWGNLADSWRISIAYGDVQAPDDNLSISLVSARGDLVVIVLTSRCEPFEGVNETINLQHGDVVAKIDDFRRMVVWKGSRVRRHRYWPKDVGHVEALAQPLSGKSRPWREVELSTLLMLFVKDMVMAGEQSREFSFSAEWGRLGIDFASET
jgi:predicted dehydrogenase